ncbi:MAG: dTDP-4-dehydrorhamnose 3,5-epimerase [Acidobacteria bacterium]|jgi:dTDP-4-dehydrorhamnose 3,5-epimerase|nr:dTDP-4-dehydrorhamnose 3,5-epimerase [Acidobacteriota bacterium]
MIVEKTSLHGVLLIKRDIFEDHRGTFVETFNCDEYIDRGIPIKFVRDAASTSSKHVLRGIHYDDKTWKLIQCMYGKIYFVVVDMHQDSPQYLKWQSFILSDGNRHQVLVPPHFGNGHLVLSDHCIFHYKMSEYYDPANEKTLKWDDPKAAIYWPVKEPVLSQKDAAAAYL